MSMYLANEHLCRLARAARAEERRAHQRRIADHAAHDAVAQWRAQGWLR